MSFFQNVALQSGESLNSLLMRKAELNGYGCAQALLGERGLKLAAAYSSPELAQICECFELKEEQLSTTLIGQTHYLGQPSYLRNGHSPVCPECLASDGYAKEAGLICWSQLVPPMALCCLATAPTARNRSVTTDARWSFVTAGTIYGLLLAPKRQSSQ